MSTLYPYKGHFPLVDPNTFPRPRRQSHRRRHPGRGREHLVQRGGTGRCQPHRHRQVEQHPGQHHRTCRQRAQRPERPKRHPHHHRRQRNRGPQLHPSRLHHRGLLPHRDGRRHPGRGLYRAGLCDRGRGPGAQGHGDPPFSVVVGSPAKVIKTLDEGSLAERLDHTQHYYHLAMENKASLGL